MARGDLHLLDIGPPAWCWSRLACTDQATLTFEALQGRFSLDVRYRLGHEQLAVLLPDFDHAGWSAVGRRATLKITGTSDDHLRWSVRATGLAHRAGGHLSQVFHDQRRSTVGGRPAWLALSALQVRGHYETVLLDGPLR